MARSPGTAGPPPSDEERSHVLLGRIVRHGLSRAHSTQGPSAVARNLYRVAAVDPPTRRWLPLSLGGAVTTRGGRRRGAWRDRGRRVAGGALPRRPGPGGIPASAAAVGGRDPALAGRAQESRATARDARRPGETQPRCRAEGLRGVASPRGRPDRGDAGETQRRDHGGDGGHQASARRRAGALPRKLARAARSDSTCKRSPNGSSRSSQLVAQRFDISEEVDRLAGTSRRSGQRSRATSRSAVASTF